MHRTTRWLGCVLLLGVVLARPVPAQVVDSIDLEPIEPAAPRYSVELILFTYGDGVATGNEVFPPDEVDEPEPAADGYEDLAFGDGQDEPEYTDESQWSDSASNAELMDDPMADPSADPGADPAAAPGAEPSSLEPLLLPADIELSVLPREQLTLTQAFETLSRLDAYRPVAWTGWTQTVHESDVTPAIRLRRLDRVPLEFDGTLKLYLSRYLHLEVDLAMEDRRRSLPQAADSSEEPSYADAAWSDPVLRPADTVHYRIREDRIVKNGDLRYFDHPKFGLLARISRVTDELEAGETEAPVLPPLSENPAAPPD